MLECFDGFDLPLQQQFVGIARKADETKASLKKSIADVEQVIKGLINV